MLYVLCSMSASNLFAGFNLSRNVASTLAILTRLVRFTSELGLTGRKHTKFVLCVFVCGNVRSNNVVLAYNSALCVFVCVCVSLCACSHTDNIRMRESQISYDLHDLMMLLDKLESLPDLATWRHKKLSLSLCLQKGRQQQRQQQQQRHWRRFGNANESLLLLLLASDDLILANARSLARIQSFASLWP